MATVDAYWRCLQVFFAWLVREEIMTSEANLMRKLHRPKVPVKVIQDIPLQLVKLAVESWDASRQLGARNRSIILMLLDTGMRLSECSGLQLQDIDAL